MDTRHVARTCNVYVSLYETFSYDIRTVLISMHRKQRETEKLLG